MYYYPPPTLGLHILQEIRMRDGTSNIRTSNFELSGRHSKLLPSLRIVVVDTWLAHWVPNPRHPRTTLPQDQSCRLHRNRHGLRYRPKNCGSIRSPMQPSNTGGPCETLGGVVESFTRGRVVPHPNVQFRYSRRALALSHLAACRPHPKSIEHPLSCTRGAFTLSPPTE